MIDFKKTVGARHSNIGYDSPFLLIQYSEQLFLIIVILLVVLPSFYLLMKLVKRWKAIHKKFEYVWSQLYFNTPLRMMTELYIEIALVVFMNFINVGH